MRNDTQIIVDIIQSVYGDASQTVLDHTAASQILAGLRRAGWASLDDVARLIDAAGGEVVVSGDILADSKERRVTRQDDFASGGVKFRASAPA